MKKLLILGVFLLLIISIQKADAVTYPDGCTATTKYSATTGHMCVSLKDCAPGDLYSQLDGHKCTATIQTPSVPIQTPIQQQPKKGHSVSA